MTARERPSASGDPPSGYVLFYRHERVAPWEVDNMGTAIEGASESGYRPRASGPLNGPGGFP
jgi:hypothetical protein